MLVKLFRRRRAVLFPQRVMPRRERILKLKKVLKTWNLERKLSEVEK